MEFISSLIKGVVGISSCEKC